MPNFAQFGLPEDLIDSLGRMKVTVPTSVQRETIPLALEGHDILASAQTGTGKTAAYLLPLIVKLINDLTASALILAPTRELAMQVHAALNKIQGNNSPFRTALLIGGAPMFKQMSDLRRKPQLIVGTPGRITDHLLRGTLSLDSTKFLVIDEADRMLDMGFEIQLNQIAEYLPKERQTLMFSATLPPNIERLSRKYLSNPKRITIDQGLTTAPKIKQEVLRVSEHEKWTTLLAQLDAREGSVIIFVKTKRRADSMAMELRDNAHDAEAMHGDLPQRRREKVILAFRNSKCRIIVATDVAARGLDIPHVMHVINYDLPECPEDYVHRIGRTGRAEAEGFALSFVSPSDGGKWKAIDRLVNPDQYANEKASPSGERSYGGGERKQWRSNQRSDQPRSREGNFGGERREPRSGGRDFGGERRDAPFVKREGGFGGERRDAPFAKREGGFGGERRDAPFAKREGNFGGERAPFVKREGNFERREPRAGGRDFGGERAPYAKREGGFGGERAPYAKREGGFSGERAPYAKREGGFGGERRDAPFVKREGFAKREGAPFVKREGFAPREDGFAKREGGFVKKEFKDFDNAPNSTQFKKRSFKRPANGAPR